PDVLWKFRWYSILNQLLVWAGIGLIFGWLLERFVGTPNTAGSQAIPQLV
ncbi:MAG: putative transrane protein, partial [Mycobacterium sp.]|nr:putative transrane protein [Mycobacterium sp.]